MPNFSQFGRPLSCTVTGGPTITDLISVETTFDPELHEHFGGGGAAGRFPRITVGNDNSRIKIKTTDIAALGCVKGMQFTSVTVTFEATATSVANTGAVSLGSANTIGMTLAPVRVVSSFQITNEATGQPGEIEVEFRVSNLESDGTAGAVTIDATLAS